MSMIEQRLEHLETTITSLRTITEAIKGLGKRMDLLDTRVERIEAKVDWIIEHLKSQED